VAVTYIACDCDACRSIVCLNDSRSQYHPLPTGRKRPIILRVTPIPSTVCNAPGAVLRLFLRRSRVELADKCVLGVKMVHGTIAAWRQRTPNAARCGLLCCDSRLHRAATATHATLPRHFNAIYQQTGVRDKRFARDAHRAHVALSGRQHSRPLARNAHKRRLRGPWFEPAFETAAPLGGTWRAGARRRARTQQPQASAARFKHATTLRHAPRLPGLIFNTAQMVTFAIWETLT